MSLLPCIIEIRYGGAVSKYRSVRYKCKFCKNLFISRKDTDQVVEVWWHDGRSSAWSCWIQVAVWLTWESGSGTGQISLLVVNTIPWHRLFYQAKNGQLIGTTAKLLFSYFTVYMRNLLWLILHQVFHITTENHTCHSKSVIPL